MQNSRVLFFLILLLSSQLVYSQIGIGGASFGKSDTSSKKLKISAFPYINYNRSQEFMYGAVLMGMFRFNAEDTLSPKSMVGAMGIGTTTETWGTMGFSKLYWKQNKWRATIYGGYFSFNFQTYWSPIPNTGTFVNYNTGYSMIYGNLLRRVFGSGDDAKLYLGAHGMYANANTTFALRDTSVKIEPSQLNNAGIDLEFDSRNDVYYPSKGFYSESNFSNYGEWLGNSKSFNKINITINNYQRIHKRVVQASRFKTAFGIGDIPFEGQEIIGQTDIRGYSAGKQRGDQVMALQTESRIHVYNRWYAVAFVGVATATSEIEDFSWDNLWPGAGGGVRFTVMKEENFNIGIDLAAGRDDWSMSFTIGESF